ncbi:MAG: hypothetical protein KC619_26850, partial [Myxococcales bacterium]|nr:hypothetical protein [Myxococcales bacterium]
CDPAMGSGAFLVAACGYLGDQLVAAWTREGRLEQVARDAPNEDPVLYARRLVAQRCLYGVDKNPAAVELAKLSLWLFTLARDRPFTFLDHALRWGDSLVGLSFEQIRSFTWEPAGKGQQVTLARAELDAALEEAIPIRQRILALALDPSPEAQLEKETLVRDAADALDRARLVGDVIVGAFFAESKKKAREKELGRRWDVVQRWLASGELAQGRREGGEGAEKDLAQRRRGAEEGDLFEGELRAMQAEVRGRLPVFHWMLEFPEVFWSKRPDPLAAWETDGEAYFDAFVGNPPFAGKNGISEANPPGYLDWFMAKYPEVKGRPNTDLSAYFFRRVAELIGAHGTVGLIATNTIAQGDSRLMSLKHLVDDGVVIYDATASFIWPGTAAVSASVVHLAIGAPARHVDPVRLDGERVAVINSRLRATPERPDPERLGPNGGLAYMGGKLVGVGLAMSIEERDQYVSSDLANAEVLRPYIGGEDVNSRPDASYSRYMIDFSTKTLEEAAAWPELLRRAEELVKPARSHDKRGTYKRYWWRPGEAGGALYAALEGMDLCIVTARVTKHLVFSMQPSSWFFSEQLYAFALATFSALAVLQSRIHEPWARLLSSSLEDRLRYAASDCFETFPFPEPDPRAVIPALEAIGERLYEARAAYMVDTDQGLTQTYNRLKDPDDHDDRVEELRRLHEEMDRCVLAAYHASTADDAWAAIEVPPYCAPSSDPTDVEAHAKLVEQFNDLVIDRLFVLNAERAATAHRQCESNV